MVGEERRGVVMFAEGFEGRYRRFHHRYVVRAKDLVEDLEDAWCNEREVLGRFLD
jgi:hypothetical protein